MGTSTLTPREQRIVKLIAQGKSSKEIAEALGISPLTVGTHRKRICSKFNVHTAAELIAQCATRAAPGSPATGHKGEVNCHLAVDFSGAGGRARFEYSGHLRRTPAAVTVRIGGKTFFF